MGKSQDPCQYEKDQYIHSENVRITRLDEEGKAHINDLKGEYMPLVLLPKEGFYEKELKRKVNQFGNIASLECF